VSIEVQRLSKHFGVFTALSEVSLRISSGELVALLGPSGSGKTTLLRIIAGLEFPDPGSGPILFHDTDVADRRVGSRRVGFVFQHYALFRHMTVFRNVAFGLSVRPRSTRPPPEEIRRRVNELLGLVQLEGLAERYPHQLSGGQRQRVALARALAVEPQVLLLDEPFGALDAKVRQDLRRWLRRLHDEIHLTSVFVTHDQEEALEVADRVVVMNQGRIEQVGTPEDVFHRPASEFVMNFLGNVNFFHGRAEGNKLHVGPLVLDTAVDAGPDSKPATLFVRPHEWEVETAYDGSPAFQARVSRINAAGPQVKLEVWLEGLERSVQVELSHERYRSLGIAAGSAVFIAPRETKVFVRGEGLDIHLE
jgi:sulfate transport system ATP-binding protein